MGSCRSILLGHSLVHFEGAFSRKNNKSPDLIEALSRFRMLLVSRNYLQVSKMSLPVAIFLGWLRLWRR
jgi:hypothetical protein